MAIHGPREINVALAQPPQSARPHILIIQLLPRRLDVRTRAEEVASACEHGDVHLRVVVDCLQERGEAFVCERRNGGGGRAGLPVSSEAGSVLEEQV